MIRTQVYIPEDLHRTLMLMAKTENRNYSSLIREGVKTIIEKKKRKVTKWGKGFIGALKYGPKDLSSHINDIYK